MSDNEQAPKIKYVPQLYRYSAAIAPMQPTIHIVWYFIDRYRQQQKPMKKNWQITRAIEIYLQVNAF